MQMKSHLSPFVGFVLLGVMAMAAGCAPKYPSCETDKQCKENEFCVDRKCQQCRDNGDCREGYACSAGKCTAIPGYCTEKSQCPAGQECIANRCRPCASDTECPSGLRCVQGTCMKPQCSTDDDCAQDQECQNGFCVAARPTASAGPPCPLDTVYFDFDRSTLTNEATSILSTNAACLKRSDRPVNLVGRADPRGTPEYNMALSDRRAQSVKEYLQRLGIPSARLLPVPRGELDASGNDEGSWSRDRRVDSEWQ
jgi:peptidoglycan-associated lipoprotein